MSERDYETAVPGARMDPRFRQHNPRGDEDVTPDPDAERFEFRRVRPRDLRRGRRNGQRT